ncbi:MAG: DUF4080 domain-containing protein [Clostridia bacterium]|nr:DUF4080 domain-containing protein [Clostridia bacterium]
MKTVIYQINSKYVHSSLAAWYLCGAVRERGCVCDVLEGSVNESEDALFLRLTEARADVVAFSAYIWNVSLVCSLAKRIKEYDPYIKVILGGPEVSYRAESIFEECPYVDYVISGEGEVPFSSLVCSLERGDAIPEYDGISSRGDVRAPYVMKDDPPCPYTDEYIERLKGRIAYIETSRGCPYRCAYCLSASSGGVRFFDVDRAKRDIITLAESGAATVKFVDRTFNADRARACEIFSFIIQKRAEGAIPDYVTFHFEIAGELVDADTIALLREAPRGLFQFEIGVQSMNDKTLCAINRRSDISKLSCVISELSSLGSIHIHTDLIAGLPYEDIESFRNSYNKLASLGSHKLQLGFLKLLYGSPMRESPEIYPCEYDSDPPYTVTSTPWLSEEDIRELVLVERANDGIYYSGRFDRTVDYLLSATGLDRYSLALVMGKNLYAEATPALDVLFDRIYELCSRMDGVDAAVLRDNMLYDRIAYDSSCVIPLSLRVYDKRLKGIARAISQKYPQRKGIRRCVGILYTESSVIYADYDKKDPVTERYVVRVLPIGEVYDEL